MRLGICCAGGGAKGAWQAGALEALATHGPTVHAISGASVGALNATLFAQGDAQKLFELWSTMRRRDVYRGPIPIPGLKWIWRLPGSSSFYNSTPLKKTIDKVLDLGSLRMSPVSLYVQLCQLEPNVYCDGGWYNNLPIRPLLRKKPVCDTVIAISLTPETQMVDWQIGEVATPADPDFAQKLLASASVPLLFQPVVFRGARAPRRHHVPGLCVTAAMKGAEQRMLREIEHVNKRVEAKGATNGEVVVKVLMLRPRDADDLAVESMLDFNPKRAARAFANGKQAAMDALALWRAEGKVMT